MSCDSFTHLFLSLYLSPWYFRDLAGQLTFALLVVLSGIRLFGQDALMRNREETGGLLLLPYFLGKVAVSERRYTYAGPALAEPSLSQAQP